FFFQAEDGIRDFHVTGVQTCALPILPLSSQWPRISAIFAERRAPMCGRSWRMISAARVPLSSVCHVALFGAGRNVTRIEAPSSRAARPITSRSVIASRTRGYLPRCRSKVASPSQRPASQMRSRSFIGYLLDELDVLDQQ